jgi:membrane-associated protease RseP (regulator of RpoE activity)
MHLIVDNEKIIGVVMMKRVSAVVVATLMIVLGMASQVSAQVTEAEQSRMELRQAREAMQEAAREVARISIQMRGQVEGGVVTGRGAWLGITISDAEDGVRVDGVTPGGPADQSGIETGDVIIAMDGAELSGDFPSELLIAQIQKFSPGDIVPLTLVRNEIEQNIEIVSQELRREMFGRRPLPPGIVDQDVKSRFLSRFFKRNFRGEPRDDPKSRFDSRWNGYLWNDLELVELTSDLASYFGVNTGILVVRAPSNVTEMLDGDVILEIGTRIPLDTEHAWRVLKSFQEGENLEIIVMRDQRRQTLEIQLESP